jgi:hypothetical protein
MSIYISRKKYQRDLLPEFRDFKLKLIQSEIDFSISKEVIKKYHNELSFIRENFKNDVITGSIALSLFGLIHRKIKDIDILIKDEGRYTRYTNQKYGGDENDMIDNRLGYINFEYKKSFFSRTRYYEVDFFKNVDAKYIEFDFEGTTLKIQQPLGIISAKMGMTGEKHFFDIVTIFSKFDI